MSVLAVSRVRLDPVGRVSEVLWGVVDTQSNHWVSTEVLAPVGEVVAALARGDQVVALFPAAQGHVPGRQFVAVDYGDAHVTVMLDGPPQAGRELADIDRLAARTDDPA